MEVRWLERDGRGVLVVVYCYYSLLRVCSMGLPLWMMSADRKVRMGNE
jgi:hypothetical protein